MYALGLGVRQAGEGAPLIAGAGCVCPLGASGFSVERGGGSGD